LSIGAACGLSWPSDRIIIQVLDDSTDPAIKVTTKLKLLNPRFLIHFASQFLILQKIIVVYDLYRLNYYVF